MNYIKSTLVFILGLVSLSFIRAWFKPKSIIIEQVAPDKFEGLSQEEKVNKFEELK